MNSIVALRKAKTYVEESLEGGGVSQGQPGKDGQNGKSAYELAISNGYTGTETDWLNSLKGSKGDKGDDGKDGKSISSIIKNDNNHIIVTFSDGTLQDIGELTLDVSADFLTSGGFGNLRYYNGKLQKYDYSKDTWVDTTATPNNVLVVNMMPNPMKKMVGIYDHNLGYYKLKWIEPEDTIIDGEVICVVDKVIIRRKKDGIPQNENDGQLVMEIPRSDFGQYNKSWYVDESLSPVMGDTYCYKAFTVATTGFVNNATVNETGALTAKDYFLYGVTVDEVESDPDSKISYIEDNTNFSSAYMDYTVDTFNYGDWQDAFFMPKPCMLKYDGTVDYYLNPNNYTQKEDGTISDIANVDYEGNAMMQFPKIYRKIVDNENNTATIYISDKKVDEGFKCWSNIDSQGNEIPYFYVSIYRGYYDGTRIRSLSNKLPITNKTAQQEVVFAMANNLTDNIIWYTDVFADIDLIRSLMLLIGKSTNSQTVFGNGNGKTYVNTSNTGIKESGTMDKKGLFWGNKDNVSGVKIFGIEDFWGSTLNRIAGWINDKGVQKIKLTYGQQDGSTVDGYNFDGHGYIEIPNATPSGTSGGYISKIIFTENGIIPKVASGSATTQYCDGLRFDNSKVNYACIGGSSDQDLFLGIFNSNLNGDYLNVSWARSSAVSCKPLLGGTP